MWCLSKHCIVVAFQSYRVIAACQHCSDHVIPPSIQKQRKHVVNLPPSPRLYFLIAHGLRERLAFWMLFPPLWAHIDWLSTLPKAAWGASSSVLLVLLKKSLKERVKKKKKSSGGFTTTCQAMPVCLSCSNENQFLLVTISLVQLSSPRAPSSVLCWISPTFEVLVVDPSQLGHTPSAQQHIRSLTTQLSVEECTWT